MSEENLIVMVDGTSTGLVLPDFCALEARVTEVEHAASLMSYTTKVIGVGSAGRNELALARRNLVPVQEIRAGPRLTRSSRAWRTETWPRQSASD